MQTENGKRNLCICKMQTEKINCIMETKNSNRNLCQK